MNLTDAVGRVLRQHPVFAGLDDADEQAIADCATLMTFQAGEYIYEEQRPADRFFLIRHGRVSLEVHVPGREAIIVDILGDDDLLGWSWLVPPYRTNFDARAVYLSRVISFDAATLRQRMDANPAFGYAIFKRMAPVIAGRLAAARRQMIDLYGRPEQRGIAWR